uniref:Ig-like domain-containing protein n=1 Tax=Erpetoichthys calabaricus TaxID=27687 RepID=A0A8C4SC44_ERPCA
IMQNLKLSLDILYICYDNSVSQWPPTLKRREGENVTLNCSYTVSASTASLNAYLQWYRKGAEEKIQYILQTYTLSEKTTDSTADGHFSVFLNTTSKTTYLTINTAQLSDSAVYYCALSPTKEHMLLQLDQNHSTTTELPD